MATIVLQSPSKPQLSLAEWSKGFFLICATYSVHTRRAFSFIAFDTLADRCGTVVTAVDEVRVWRVK